jgi:hypothetical protein
MDSINLLISDHNGWLNADRMGANQGSSNQDTTSEQACSNSITDFWVVKVYANQKTSSSYFIQYYRTVRLEIPKSDNITLFLRKQTAFLFDNANTGHFYSNSAA